AQKRPPRSGRGRGAGEPCARPPPPARLEHPRRVVFLEEGEGAELTADRAVITTFDGKPVERAAKVVAWDAVTAQKGGFKHFLLKEIHEQPQAIIDTMRGRILQQEGDVQLDVEVTDNVPTDAQRRV